MRISAASAFLIAAAFTAAAAAQASPRTRPTWGEILVAGGVCYDIDLPLASAELYDPASNRFSDRRLKMKSIRSGAAAALIAGGPNAGKVLITGGYGSDYRELSSAELYNPANNAFMFGPAMHDERVWHTATAIVSGPKAGKILIAGGQGANSEGHLALRSTDLYDPTTNTFERGPDMQSGRFAHTASPIVSGPNAGKIFLAGGTDANFHPLSSTELYDPASDTIRPGPTTNSPRAGHTATVIFSGKNAGKILITGGQQEPADLASTELYDPATNTISSGPAMKIGRKHHTATVVQSGPNAGKILIAGGDYLACKGNDCHGDGLSSTELYDPEANAFTPGPSMNRSRAGHTATVVKDGPNAGKILISGGMYHSGQPLPTDLYDPVTNTFVPEARTPARDGGCDDTISIQLPPAPPPR